MKYSIPTISGVVIGSVIGCVITILAYQVFSSNSSSVASMADENKPLYWVAPMDANYKRDKPGLSPMGMDLIAVYKNAEASSEVGSIKISPSVVHNLGVRIESVQSKPLNTEMKTVGYVQYDEDKLVHVHSRVEGWIEKLYVQTVGDPVKKGQPLYDIYSPRLVNAQEELVLALNRNNRRLIQAAEDRLKALQIPVKVIENLKRSKKVKQSLTFYASQSGVIDNLSIREGFFVKPSNILMSIGALDQVWVEAEIFERQAAFISAGNLVRMTLDYLPGKVWQGKVDYVYPTLDSKTRTLKARLRFDNKDKLLKPNMFANIVIYSSQSEVSLLVSKDAVIRTGTMNRVVLAQGDGQFKSIEVTVGRLASGYAEILTGLKEGDKVVSSAQFLLDSESSKTSDFKRMDNASKIAEVNAVWVAAVVNEFSEEDLEINVTHQAIPVWEWPQMNMDFDVVESIDFSKIKEGLALSIEIIKTEDDDYFINQVKIPDSESGVQQ